MNKKILSGLCALALVLGSAAALPQGFAKIDSAITASAETYGDYDYTVLDDGTVVISKYIGSDEEVTIPSTIDGKKVTSIGDYAFKGCTSLTSVTIPDSVTSIGKSAFCDCTSLTSVTIPDSVTSIGDSAFEECLSLTSINIPDSVTSIGDDAFAYCESLTSVTIPDSVTSIGYRTFGYCTSLTSVTIPNSVTSIGDYAFVGCESLTSVTIRNSVTSIGPSAFGIYWDEEVSDFSKVDGFTIYGYKGSTAETYAKENGFKFVELQDDTRKKGDLNDNGKIDASDLLQVKSHIKKVKPLEGDDFTCADVDGNGAINAADLLKMKAHMKGVSSIWG